MKGHTFPHQHHQGNTVLCWNKPYGWRAPSVSLIWFINFLTSKLVARGIWGKSTEAIKKEILHEVGLCITTGTAGDVWNDYFPALIRELIIRVCMPGMKTFHQKQTNRSAFTTDNYVVRSLDINLKKSNNEIMFNSFLVDDYYLLLLLLLLLLCIIRCYLTLQCIWRKYHTTCRFFFPPSHCFMQLLNILTTIFIQWKPCLDFFNANKCSKLWTKHTVDILFFRTKYICTSLNKRNMFWKIYH